MSVRMCCWDEFTHSVYHLYHLLFFSLDFARSGGGVVDNTPDHQSRDRKVNPRFSGLSDETLNRGPVSV